MKKNTGLIKGIKVLFVFILFGFVTSCKDGKDGDIYLDIWDNSDCVTGYWDDNPNIPYGMSYGVTYSCTEGTYDYEYTTEGARYWGFYSLNYEYGEEAGIFNNGEDGSDRYYHFWLWDNNDLGVPDIEFDTGKEHVDNSVFQEDFIYDMGEGFYLHVTRNIEIGGKMTQQPKKINN